ncbi:iron-containing redox enzyme family protein [Bdellovibrio sp. NC01]|uniref:iron-containing redox enzyme family protein n=1 Tax=Bdellovibrio sp. NC01 TaxID=2220073 RepID=UPI001157F567|nr:iron-containing redox enzyme family protein [Bdellovibrio sp. NC01]QDK38303.1 hypothetical protein DOE51_12305 [Bdellovibrio sp. NC01]
MGKILTTDAILAALEKPKKALRESPWEDKNFYAEWVAQTGHFVRHSTRLLALAAARCTQEQQAFHNRFIPHATEEKGHEKLAFMDLKNLGFQEKDFPEAPATQSLYQPQYYWIEYKNSLAFFGYILCLEILAKDAGPHIEAKTTKAFGPKCSHFIRVHVEEDEGHVEEAMKMVTSIEGPEEKIILDNLIQSCDNYTKMVEYCRERATSKKLRAAG